MYRSNSKDLIFIPNTDFGLFKGMKAETRYVSTRLKHWLRKLNP